MEVREENKPVRISGLLLIALHLAPGLIFGGVFLVLSRAFIRSGLTGYLALLVSIPVCLVPIEIGIMLLWSIGDRRPPLSMRFCSRCITSISRGNVPGIFAAFVPTAFVVMVKKNWQIGVAFHSVVNLWGVYGVATSIT